MEFGISSLVFKRYPIEAVFEKAASIGFNGVEIWGGRPHAYPYDADKCLIETVRRLKAESGLKVPMYTPELLSYQFNVASEDKKEISETIDYLKRAADFAIAIDCPRMLIATGFAPLNTGKKDNLNRVCDLLMKVSDYIEGAELSLIVEEVAKTESNVLISLEDIMAVLEAVNRENIKSMLDTVPPWVHWEPYTEYFARLGDKLDYIHFMDSKGEDHHHFPLGEGNIPIEALAEVIKGSGYDGWITNEMLSPYCRDAEFYAARELVKLKKLFGVTS